MKCIYLSIILLLPLPTHADNNQIGWSTISRKDRISVYNLTIRFFDAYNKNEFHKIRQIIPDKEISYGGRLWMSIPKFSYLVSHLREKGPVRHDKIYVLSFDECNRDSSLKKVAIQHFPVFDNNCIISILKKSKKASDRASPFYSLVFQRNIKSRKWELVSISGFESTLDKKSIPNPITLKKGWRKDSIQQLDLTLLIPPGFSHRINHGSLMEYYYAKNNLRQCAIQVMAAKNSRPLLDNAREWLTAFLNSRRYTTVRLKLLPAGYRFDCEILDRDGKKNKVIVGALKSGRYSIFVVFIGYMKPYENIRQEIDFLFNTLSVD